MFIAYIIWVVLAVACYFMLPEFISGLNIFTQIAYSLFISWIISMIYAAYVRIKNIKVADSESVEEGSESSDTVAAKDMIDLTGKTIPSSRVVNMEPIRGELIFSQKGITFNPNAYNIQNEPASWKYSDINALKAGTMNNITFTTMNGDTEILVVEHKKEVLTYLKRQVLNTRENMTDMNNSFAIGN